MPKAASGNKFQSFRPIPPGATLAAELRARKLPRGTFASWIGQEEKDLKRIIRGANPVTPALAQKLERALDIPATFWLNYENAYRAGLTRASDNEIPMPARIGSSLLGVAAGPHKRLHFSLLEIERIPEATRGVYLFWHEESGVCIYVGMAENQPLKECLKQHWRGSHNKTLALLLRAFGRHVIVSYIPIKECGKIPQAKERLIRLWKPVANQ